MIVESKLRENFFPLTYTKLSASLLFGTRSLRESIEEEFSAKATDILVPNYLQGYTYEIFPDLQVNASISSECIIANSHLSYNPPLWKFIFDALNREKECLYVDTEGNVVFGKIKEFDPKKLDLLGKIKSIESNSPKIQIRPLPSELEKIAMLRFPWELVRLNSDKITQDFSSDKNFSSTENPRSGDIETRGGRIWISSDADIERFVTLDSRKGPIIIDSCAEVQSFSHITGPAYIGKKVKVKTARIREGTTIGASSKISGEVESSIIGEFSNKSHDGFLGHSIVGSWSNLGALTTCSDLKNTYGNIGVKLGRKTVNTGEIKVGVFMADMTKTAIGTLLTSGKKIGVASQVFGLVAEDVPSFTMYGKSLGAKSSELILDSALLTQKRMMERRGLSMTKTMEALIRSVYKMTIRERAFQRVSKARFKLP